MPVRNICQCPYPPGGTVSCSKDQMALCVIKNREVKRICQDVIKDEDDLAVVNFVLSVITEMTRTSNNEISLREIDILRSGTFKTNRNYIANFTLPEFVIQAVDNIDRSRGVALV